MSSPLIRSVLFALLFTFIGSARGQETRQRKDQQEETPTSRKIVNLVSVFFTVRDHRGALLSNLSKDDFEVFENGEKQTIKYFSAESLVPLTLGVLIDSSRRMEYMLPEDQRMGAEFLRQVITEKDLAFILSFDTSVDLLQDLTSNAHLLTEGLNRARINIGGGSEGIPSRGQGPVRLSHPPGALLYDAVYLAATEVLGRQVGRKALVVLTNGNDEGSKLKLRDAIESAQKADAICYVLLLHDRQNVPPGAGDMRQLTEATGGRMIDVNNPRKIGDAFKQISDELRSQYGLGYSPENSKRDGTFRKIEIRSKGGHEVQARNGYYAPPG